MIERYLIFDSGCALCSQLAATVREATADRVQPLSIHDARAQTLLNQARPAGWDPAPYLVIVAGGRARAWTGTASAARLAALAGPRGAWRIWAAARRQGIYLPPGPTQATVGSLSRRSFLRLTAGATAALAAIGLLPATTAFACEPCISCGCHWVVGARCYNTGRGNCEPWPYIHGLWLYCDIFYCYDGATGEYCYGEYRNCGCAERCF